MKKYRNCLLGSFDVIVDRKEISEVYAFKGDSKF